MSVKITALEAENVKRIKAVALTPSPTGLTIVGGNNNQGKTSVLDALAWALGGEKFRPTAAVRDGALAPPHLKVILSNGVVVERKGKNSSLTVTDPTGQRSGQQLLNAFVEPLALDLPRFMQASDKDKADTLLNIVPTNPVAALAEGNMLQIIFFALCLGGAILLIGEKGLPLLAVCDSLAEAMYALTGFIMKLAPVAVFALIAPVVAELGPRVLLAFLGVILVVYGACLLHMLVGYSIAVGGIARVNPLTFFRTALPALVFAFSSASSAGTLPFSMEAARRLGVPAPVRSFVLPLGATINMDGTAIYQGVCALFIANAYGIPLDLGQQVTIVLTCTLASVGTAGVPGAGVVMLTMVLQSVGLPVEGVALVAGIDRVLDMARTTVNITGDIACSAVVAATEGGLKPERP